MTNPFSLSNKTILVTGASSGIGKAIAIECAGLGATLVITGRNEERLQATQALLQGNGHAIIVADLNLPQGVEKVVAHCTALSGVVFCAGVGASLPFPFYTNDKMKTVMENNFFLSANLCLELVKNKKMDRDGSSMVFISSISGTLVSYPGNAVYSAAKAALYGLVKGIAIDLAPKRIRVNAVSPAMIETPMVDALEEKVTKEMLEADRKRYPLGRYGTPQEVAYAVAYLLSDAAKWTTGTNLIIDGGFTLL